jgi:hypothetical protein
MTSGRTLTCADTLHRGPSFWVGVAGIALSLETFEQAGRFDEPAGHAPCGRC